MAKIATEFQGFLKFIARANKDIIRWFGPHCNYDPSKITFMAAREWDGMADDERKFFVKAQILSSREGERRAPSGSNPFLCYLLHKRYTNFPSTSNNNQTLDRSIFHPQQARFHSEDWRALSKQEREKYAGVKLSELGLDHVIEKRDKLHQLYDPNELTILEFILKTEPKRPKSPRAWFLAQECLSISSPEAKERWRSLSSAERRYYDECARLDKRRYKFEKSAWITKLLSVDLDGDKFTIADFESQRSKSNVTTLSTMIELNRELVPTERQAKRPMSPFSIFIRDYRYQTREQVPDFKFGQHLRDSAAAWAKLPEETKQAYKDKSKKLRETYKETFSSKGDDENRKLYPHELSESLFRHVKSIHGPSRPSHLLFRLQKASELYGKANNIKRKDREEVWNSLTEEEKEPYYKEYENLKTSISEAKNKMSEKLSRLNELITKAKELEKVKRNLYLLRNRKQ